MLTTRLPSSIYSKEGVEDSKDKIIYNKQLRNNKEIIKNSNNNHRLIMNRKVKRTHILLSDIQTGISKEEISKSYTINKKSHGLNSMSKFIKRTHFDRLSTKQKEYKLDSMFSTINLQCSKGTTNRKLIDINFLKAREHFNSSSAL